MGRREWQGPADGGASGVGLIMQVTGRLTLWGLALWLVPQLVFPLGGLGVLLAEPGPRRWGLVVLIALSALRSGVHGRVGRRVAQGDLSGLPLYLGVAVVQTLATVALLADLAPQAQVGLPVVTLLMAWPVVIVGVLYRPAARALRAEGRRPVAEDRGLTGLALLMAGLGIPGALLALISLVGGLSRLQFTGTLQFTGMRVLDLALTGSLLVRGVIHGQAGLRMLRAFDPDRFRRDRQRYFRAALVTAGVAGLYPLWMTQYTPGLVMLPYVPVILGLLLAWPLVVRSYGARDPGASAAEAPVTPAPDAGLSLLAVLLLASAAWSATTLLFGLVGPPVAPFEGLAAVHEELQGRGMIAIGLLVVTRLWAGVALFAQRRQARLAIWVSLATVVGVTAYNLIGADPAQGSVGLRGTQQILLLAELFAAVGVPILALIQLYRLPRRRTLSAGARP